MLAMLDVKLLLYVFFTFDFFSFMIFGISYCSRYNCYNVCFIVWKKLFAKFFPFTKTTFQRFMNRIYILCIKYYSYTATIEYKNIIFIHKAYSTSCIKVINISKVTIYANLRKSSSEWHKENIIIWTRVL